MIKRQGKPGNYFWLYYAATAKSMCNRYLDNKCFFNKSGKAVQVMSQLPMRS